MTKKLSIYNFLAIKVLKYYFYYTIIMIEVYCMGGKNGNKQRLLFE